MQYKNRILNLVAVMSKEFLVIYLRADTKWGKQDYIGGCTQSNASGAKWLTQGFEGLRGYSAKGGGGG
jgi:hypothetical protein